MKVNIERKLILCACGCGAEIPYWSERLKCRRKFKHGHNRYGITGENHQNWKGGFWISHGGYKLVMDKQHIRADKDGYVKEHILNYEKYYKCCILKSTIIHHINGIKTDNRIENLRAMTASIHSSYHRKKELSDGKTLFGGINRWGQTITNTK